MVVVMMAALGYGYFKGCADEYWIGQADVLRAQLEAMKRDLTIEQNAATDARGEAVAAQS